MVYFGQCYDYTVNIDKKRVRALTVLACSCNAVHVASTRQGVGEANGIHYSQSSLQRRFMPGREAGDGWVF